MVTFKSSLCDIYYLCDLIVNRAQFLGNVSKPIGRIVYKIIRKMFNSAM